MSKRKRIVKKFLKKKKKELEKERKRKQAAEDAAKIQDRLDQEVALGVRRRGN